jgi:hypothetical protein
LETDDALTIQRYAPQDLESWNQFNRDSRNGTFLFDRAYMDYHQQVFQDYSLVVQRDRLIALLPANKAGDAVFSHQGLTFGGFVVDGAMTQGLMLGLFKQTLDFLAAQGVTRFVYKVPPHIYARYPSEEDLFALHQAGARLIYRQFMTVLDLRNPLPFQTRRKRGAQKAAKEGVSVAAAGEPDQWREYWQMLTQVLAARFDSPPVHTIDEMLLLQSRFPEKIRLYIARVSGRMVAGVVIYEFNHVVKTQYIAASEEGRALGALDLLFQELLTNCYGDRAYFDFGSSMGSSGKDMNQGLVDQKEGFGGRSVVQDTYEVMIS